jgi:NAD(P)-dependent dehydrogenase (short-subunit alcohol dehydrogenase family)
MQPDIMQGKTVLVTGATNGIGLVAATQIAAMGAQVVIVSRSEEKCAAVTARIRKEAGNDKVEYIAADLSTRAGVRQAAEEFLRSHKRLDVLLNNAGGFFMSRQVSADGLEMTFALNHLGYFHLTRLLLDVIQSSGPARIVNVSSDAHRGAQIDFDDLQSEKNYAGFRTYARSKLANLLFTYELARRLEGTAVTVNALHPGFVNTGFAKNNGWLAAFAMNLIGPLMARKPAEGAETSIHLATSAEVEGISGKYFTDRKIVESDPASYDRQAAEQLWRLSEDLITT